MLRLTAKLGIPRDRECIRFGMQPSGSWEKRHERFRSKLILISLSSRKFLFLDGVFSSVLISNPQLFFWYLVLFSFYESLKFVFQFRICFKKIIGDLFCDFKMMCKTFSVFLFSHENEIMKLSTSISDTDANLNYKSLTVLKFTNSRLLSWYT